MLIDRISNVGSPALPSGTSRTAATVSVESITTVPSATTSVVIA